MAFTKITNAELNSRGATTLPNVPTIGATALKQEFDAPAKNIVAPKVNNLIDELQASTAAADLGAVAPTGRTGTSVQSVLNSISSDLGNAEAQSHAHPNKAVIDKFADDGTGLTYDGNPVGAVTSVNSQTGAVVLTASDVGALPSTTAIPTKTSDLTNDSGFITASSLPTKTSQLTNDSGFITSGDIPTIPTKTSDLTNDSNFVADASYVHTDNNYDATAKAIVDGATAAIAAKSTVVWNQIDTTGTKIAEITIDGVKTDVKATGGGGSADAYKTIDAGGQSFVASGADTFKINAGSNVTITPLTGDKGIQISAAGGGTSTGDMLMNDYDRSGDVKSASSSGNGIKDYVASAISGKADTSSLATVATTGAYSDLSGKPTLATVATSGSYSDLTNQPTIPTVDQTYSASSDNAQSGTAVAEVVEQIYADNGVLGAKNLLPNNATSRTINGVTFTVNADKSVTVNGTNTGGDYRFELGEFTLPAGSYIVNGLKSNGGYSSFWINLYNLTDGSNIKDVKNANEDVEFILSDSKRVVANIYCARNATISNIIIYPMIRLASDPDDTYVPYAPTNAKLNEEKMSYADNGVLGAKNIWDESHLFNTKTEVTYTLTDHIYTINTMAEDYSGIYIGKTVARQYYSNYVGVRAKMVFEIKGDGTFNVQTLNNVVTSVSTEYKRVEISISDLSQIDDIVFYNRTTMAHTITVKNLMIVLASDPDSTYAPYAMTNRELTEEKLSISELKTIASSAADFAAFKTAIANL